MSIPFPIAAQSKKMEQTAYKSDRFTYADYCTWPEEERWELIDGQAYAMSPAPAHIHQDIVVELVRQIGNHLQGDRCRIYTAPFDVRLPEQDQTDAEIATVVQPDITVICDPAKLDDKGCHGAPDWIIEVLSPATAAKDQIQKRALYERHGVPEHWIVHPTDRILFIYRLETRGYGAPRILATTGVCPPAAVPGLTIDWDQVFTPDLPRASC